VSGSGIGESSTACGTVSHSGVSAFLFSVSLLHDASKHIATQVIVVNNIVMRFIAIKASIQNRRKDMEKCVNGKIAGLSV
jgi:hypothetical protein